jgi:hypothetical protein
MKCKFCQREIKPKWKTKMGCILCDIKAAKKRK